MSENGDEDAERQKGKREKASRGKCGAGINVELENVLILYSLLSIGWLPQHCHNWVKRKKNDVETLGERERRRFVEKLDENQPSSCSILQAS